MFGKVAYVKKNTKQKPNDVSYSYQIYVRGTDCVTEQMVILFAAYPISISPAKLKEIEYIVKVSAIDLQYFAVLNFFCTPACFSC